MTLDNVLGLDRFEQQRYWRCSGRVEGEVDDSEPRTFIIERDGERWAMTDGDGSLGVMGDATRDLVVAGGGLERRPAPTGFRAFLSASLVRETGLLSRDSVAASEVVSEPGPVTHATRPAVEIGLRTNDSTWTLRVDDETGIWVQVQTETWLVTVDDLVIGPSSMPTHMLALLNHLPDVDLSHREPVSDALSPVLDAVQEASGLQVKVLS